MTDTSSLTPQYDIAISVAGEDRDYARDIAERLEDRQIRVFYDELEAADMWGANLLELLDDVFRKRARFVIAVISRHYVNKPWTTHEGRIALSRALVEPRPYFLPVRLDDSELPGLQPSIAYVDARKTTPEKLVELITEKLGKSSEPSAITVSESERKRSTLLGAINGTENLYMIMDLGGTKAYVSLMNREAERVYDRKFSTEGHSNAEKLYTFVKRSIREAIDEIHESCSISVDRVESRISAFGIAFPGPTDPERGLVLNAPNLRVKNFPLGDRMQRTFRKPTFVDNDVNLGVMGEAWKGAARGCRNVVGIIMGTGIGGGILIDGRIYRGTTKAAGEIGHMVIDSRSEYVCPCGQQGCFEALASRKSMARDLHARKISAGVDELMFEEDNLGSNDIAYYYRKGDADAVAVVESAARACGKAVFSILNAFNPEIVIFGGGFIRRLGDIFLQEVRAEADKCMDAIYDLGDRKVPIQIGTLDNPMLVGACRMVVDGTSQKKRHDRGDFIEALTSGLGEDSFRLLRALHRYGEPASISTDPGSNFFKDKLRVLRDRGLIRTETGQSLGNSESVEITEVGRMVDEDRGSLS